tara:strand:+ start:654 stop:998 length:345 start_codon:yes stop_codon:yes gene_type:complete
MNEQELTPMIIDLGMARKGEITEGQQDQLEAGIKMIMKMMLGASQMGIRFRPITLRGTRNELSTFAKALGREKRYIQAYNKFGLDDPRTYKSKFRLNKAIRDFRRATGLRWPFK